MTIGIYKLEFSNGQIYIGQSNNVEKRLANHIHKIRAGKHSNYKIRACSLACTGLTAGIIEECSLSSLNDREIYWMNYYDCRNYGLNIAPGGGYDRAVPTAPVHRSIEDTFINRHLGKILILGLLGSCALIFFNPVLLLAIPVIYYVGGYLC